MRFDDVTAFLAVLAAQRAPLQPRSPRLRGTAASGFFFFSSSSLFLV